MGVLENLAGGYLDPLFPGAGIKEVAPFVALVVILMVRPCGLFGTREIERLYKCPPRPDAYCESRSSRCGRRPGAGH